MWLNFIFLTPFGEPGFAFWLMALLSYQQHPPFRFDVEFNWEISIICNFRWIDAKHDVRQTSLWSAILEAWA
jgi:hypothetical protein